MGTKARRAVRQAAGGVPNAGTPWSIDPVAEALPPMGGRVQVDMVTCSYVETDRFARYEQPLLQCDTW